MSAAKFAIKHPKIAMAAAKFAMKHPQLVKAAVSKAASGALPGLSSLFSKDSFGS